MKKENFTIEKKINETIDDSESNQPDTYMEENFDEINSYLKNITNSGEIIKKDFLNSVEINNVVEETNIKTKILTDNAKNNILKLIRNSKLTKHLSRIGLAATLMAGFNDQAKSQELVSQNLEQRDKNLNINPISSDYDITKINPEINKEFLPSIEEIKNNIDQLTKRSEEIQFIYREMEISKECDKILNEDFLKMESKIINANDTTNKEINEERIVYQRIKDKLDSLNNESRLNYEKFNNPNNKVELSEKIKKYQEKIPKIVDIFEKKKQDLIDAINNDEYLKKIASEFDCNLEEAKEHQKVRIQNAKLVKYEIRSTEELEILYGCKAYYKQSEHKICIPYDTELEMISSYIEHELWHSTTLGNKGLSLMAKKLLTDTFKDSDEYKKNFNNYLNNPTERYARFKILDQELIRLKLKETEQPITKENYDRLIELFNKEPKDGGFNLDKNAYEFIKTTLIKEDNGCQILNELFKEIASNVIPTVKNYYHDGWDYNNKA